MYNTHMFNKHRKTTVKTLLAILALSIASTAFAAKQSTVDVSKLTPEQISQINKQVSEMSSDPTTISANVRKEAEAWGDLGANMGKALVGAAREVGVAANEFGQTSLGKVVVGIVTYKIVGRDILGVIVGSLILVFGYSLAIWIFVTHRWSSVTYEYEPVLWGMFNRQRVVKSSMTDDVAITKTIAAGILLLLTTLVGLNTIF